MQIQCPKCNAFLKSKNALAFHMLQDEQCYPSSNDSIADRVKENLEKKEGQVHFLLLKEPSTRGSNMFLYGWYNVIFAKTHIYEAGQFKPTAKAAIKLAELNFQTRPDTLSRAKRNLQLEDKKLYHKKREYTNEKGKVVIDYLDDWEVKHECILTSSQTQLKHEIEEQAYRDNYGRGN